MDNLTWLTSWYGERCDGEWESDYGVNIESVNNPGWMVRIDLDGTGLDPDAFEAVADQRTETDWVECKVEEGVWLGGGGVENLDEVIGVFRAWVEGGERPAKKSFKRESGAPRDRAGAAGGPPRFEGKRPFKPWGNKGGGKKGGGYGGGRHGGGGKFRGPSR